MERYKNDDDYINSLEGKERYNILLSQADKEKLNNWKKEQENLKNNLSNEDDPLLQDIMYIGGMDISYDKFDKKVGISGLVIIDYKTFEIVYEDYNLVKIDEPYIPGFLAFREVKHLVKLIDDLKKNSPQFLPQVIILDGNGILHPREFGVACHLGVLTDTTTIGCSKSVFSVDGIYKDSVKNMTSEFLHKKGDSHELIGNSGRQWGYILKSSNQEEDAPLIISMGNKITNQTALKIVKKMCKNRIPEPIRLADLITRRLIRARQKYGKENNIGNWNLKDYLVNQHDYLHNNLEQYIEDEKDKDNNEDDEFKFRGRGRGYFRGRNNFRGRIRGYFRGREGRGGINEGEGEIKNKEKYDIDFDNNEEKDKEEIFGDRGRGNESGRFIRGRGRGIMFNRGRGRGRGRMFNRGRGRGYFKEQKKNEEQNDEPIEYP
jgi:deoxyinosine 3'endonuclease (endonuclease V)